MSFIDSVRDPLGEVSCITLVGLTLEHARDRGAVCVWVAEIRMLPAGIPAFFSASVLAASINSFGIMQLSTTTIATIVFPSSRTRHRAWSGSWAAMALRSANPPFTETGNFSGVTSCA